MAICKHCGTEYEEGLEYCPNCGQKIELEYGEFFEPDENLEEEAYNIFDAPEEFDMEDLLSKEFQTEIKSRPERAQQEYVEPEFPIDYPDEADETVELTQELGNDDLAQILGVSADEIGQTEVLPMEEPQELSMEEMGFDFPMDLPEAESEAFFADMQTDTVSSGGMDFPTVEENDFIALDDLFQDLDEIPSADVQDGLVLDQGLEELLAVSETTEGTPKKSKNKNTIKSFWIQKLKR